MDPASTWEGPMNLADVKIAVGMNIDLYRGLVQFLYEEGKIPKQFQIDQKP
jgi:pyoverdine/dityrosine biosynthesis protein Dit1